jgi:acetylornithine deacetylase/succinyl-diaminopimelate desuccinylase-like protein
MGKRFYPIMVAEKQYCHIAATITGQAGHGSLPLRGEAMARLGSLLLKLDAAELPVRITPVSRRMIESIAAQMPPLQRLVLTQILRPFWTDRILGLLGPIAGQFTAIFHNTASPTRITASSKINVIPGEIILELDGRLLPGCTPEDLIRELSEVAGPDIHFDVVRFDPCANEIRMDWFPELKKILEELDPGGHPIPLLLPAVTDGRFFGAMGIQTYGFLPMKLPPSLAFSRTIHGANERIPVSALEFGAQAIYSALFRRG